jgi:hypothetical protein
MLRLKRNSTLETIEAADADALILLARVTFAGAKVDPALVALTLVAVGFTEIFVLVRTVRLTRQSGRMFIKVNRRTARLGIGELPVKGPAT